MEAQTFVLDIDDTISHIPEDQNSEKEISKYPFANPIQPVIDKINLLYERGHKIILLTARGMRTFNHNVEKVEEFHRPILEKWLSENGVNYHQLVFGKPWGPNVRYIDDRGLTIDQFVNADEKSYDNCLTLNKKETYAKL